MTLLEFNTEAHASGVEEYLNWGFEAQSLAGSMAKSMRDALGKLCTSPACATVAIFTEDKTTRTPCSRPTPGRVGAVIGENRPVPRKRRNMIGLCQVRRLLRRVPCQGSNLDCLARLASIRTWRNARRGTCAELPWLRLIHPAKPASRPRGTCSEVPWNPRAPANSRGRRAIHHFFAP